LLRAASRCSRSSSSSSLAGLVLSLLGGGGNAPGFIAAAATRVVFSLLLALAASFVLLRFLPRLPIGRALILQSALPAGSGDGPVPSTGTGWLGREGRADSPLRPAGIAAIDGQRVDVVSEGEYIEAGERVRVTRVDGNRIVVRKTPITEGGTQA
jgi:membrane-bound serine protease (ClpP class)